MKSRQSLDLDVDRSRSRSYLLVRSTKILYLVEHAHDCGAEEYPVDGGKQGRDVLCDDETSEVGVRILQQNVQVHSDLRQELSVGRIRALCHASVGLQPVLQAMEDLEDQDATCLKIG